MTPSAVVDISGGPGGQPGRVLYGDAVVGIPGMAHTVTPASTARELAFVPVYPNPYFAPTINTPNIVPASSSGPNLDGGPGPFGLLFAPSDLALANAIAAAPANAVAVVARYDTGPTNYAVAYNVSNVLASADTLDMYLVYNLTSTTVPVTFNGVGIGQLPFDNRIEFGGDDQFTGVLLPHGRTWATLGPESAAPQTVQIAFGGVPAHAITLNTPPTNGAIFQYLIGDCIPADLLAVTQHPDAASTCRGGSASFSVVVTGDTPSYQWRRNGLVINPALNTSATTATLFITNAVPDDEANYDCTVTNTCGSLTSDAAPLSVCIGDVDCDGDTDSDDIVAFFNAWDSGDPQGDTDGDGDTDSDDIITFFTAWDSGC